MSFMDSKELISDKWSIYVTLLKIFDVMLVLLPNASIDRKEVIGILL
jgi:hypothetical protein